MKKIKNELGISFDELRTYNPKFHDKHRKGWTTSEIQLITSKGIPLVEQSLQLGRSIYSIITMRNKIKKESTQLSKER